MGLVLRTGPFSGSFLVLSLGSGSSLGLGSIADSGSLEDLKLERLGYVVRLNADLGHTFARLIRIFS